MKINLEGKKIIKIRPLLKERVKLRFKGRDAFLDEEKGELCEVTWYSDGHTEIQTLRKPCGIRASGTHIPFNPVTHEALVDLGWGDDKYDYNKEDL